MDVNRTDIVLENIESCVAAFESHWLTSGKPNIAAFLPAESSPYSMAVLIELVCIDMEFRWASGEPEYVESYLTKFPGLQGVNDALFQIAQHEYKVRCEAGEQVNVDEYLRRLGCKIQAKPVIRESFLQEGSLKSWRARVHEMRENHSSVAQRNAGASMLQSTAHMSQPIHLAADAEIAGFRIVRLLGRGSFGSVYLAEQCGLAQRQVVLKIGQHLYHESQHLAQLQHTNIVPIYSTHTVNNLQVLCMPYLGSTTLQHVLSAEKENGVPSIQLEQSTIRAEQEHTLNANATEQQWNDSRLSQNVENITLPEIGTAAREEQCLKIVAQLATGLQHAHTRGVVHNDLKPANILIAHDKTPLILDFNLADSTQNHSQQRALLGGTLPYMAPEQLQSLIDGIARASFSSDIYALGIILFELLTGERPFDTQAETSLAAIEQLWQERSTQLAPSIRRRFPHYTQATESIVQHCLKPQLNMRYSSAQDLLDDLECQLGNLPLKHVREPMLERSQKFFRRNSRAVSWGLVGVLVLLMCGAMFLANSQTRRAQQAESLTYKSEFETQLLNARLLLALPFPTASEKEEGKTIALQALQIYGLPSKDDWNTHPRLTALPSIEQTKMLTQLQEVYALLESRQYPIEKPALFSKQLHTERENSKAKQAEDHVLELVAQGKFYAASALLEELLNDAPNHAALWAQLGACKAAIGDNSNAIAAYNSCIALRPTLWRAYLWRGQCYLEMKLFSKAERDFNKVLQSQVNYVPALTFRALAHLGNKQVAAAETDITRAIELAPENTRLLFMSARIRQAQGNVAGANSDRQLGFKLQPHDELSYIARGIAWLPTHPQNALSDFDNALKINAFSRDALQNKAHVLSEHLHDTPGAIACLNTLLQQYSDFAPARMGYAVLLARSEKHATAQQECKQALANEATPVLHYQAACVYALAVPKENSAGKQAVHHLTQAFKEGFGLELFANDPDLANLRENAELKNMVEAVLKSLTLKNS